MTAKDNLALVVLCSTLGYDMKSDKNTVKPLTTTAYNKLEARMDSLGFMPSIFLEERFSDISGLFAFRKRNRANIAATWARR